METVSVNFEFSRDKVHVIPAHEVTAKFRRAELKRLRMERRLAEIANNTPHPAHSEKEGK